MINFFNIIKKRFNKKLLPNFIHFNNTNNHNITEIKNIIIWLMCVQKKNFICKYCESCVNFKKNKNYDFYEIKNINESSDKIKVFLNTKPIFSKIKVILFHFNIKSSNIINFIENNIKDKPIYIFLLLKENELEIKNNNLTLNVKKDKSKISITIIKIMYNSLMHINNYKLYTNIINLDKKIIIHSLIFFLKIYLKNNNSKKYKILMNKKITYKIADKNIIDIIILLKKYEKIFLFNKNLNTFILIDFLLEYFNN